MNKPSHGKKADGGSSAKRPRPAPGKASKNTAPPAFKKRKQTDEIVTAKKSWEQARRRNTSPEDRAKHIEAIMNVLTGNVVKFVYKHDTSRIVQTVLKYGTEEQRQQIRKELKGTIVDLSKQSYSRYLVSKLIRYSQAEARDQLISEFYGSVAKLVRHKYASVILERAYRMYCTTKQRSLLLEEFYGPEFAIFKDKSKKGKSLQEVLASASPEKRKAVLKFLGDQVNVLVEKGLVDHTIVHRLCMEYITNAEYPQKLDLINSLHNAVLHMLHTREGAIVGAEALTFGTAKDRKHIVKSLKGHVEKVACDDCGYMVLCRVLDTVDDTVLLRKSILSELTSSEALEKIAFDKYGVKVLIHLLDPVQKRLFPVSDRPIVLRETPMVLSDPADDNSEQVPASKKDSSIRRSELLAQIVGDLVKFCASKCAELMATQSGCDLIAAVLLNAHEFGATVKVKNALVRAIDEDTQAEKGLLEDHSRRDDMLFLVNAYASRTIRYLIKATTTPEFRAAYKPANDDDIPFSMALYESIAGSCVDWCLKGGNFVVYALLLAEDTKARVAEELTKGLKHLQKKKSMPGMQQLIDLLKEA